MAGGREAAIRNHGGREKNFRAGSGKRQGRREHPQSRRGNENLRFRKLGKPKTVAKRTAEPENQRTGEAGEAIEGRADFRKGNTGEQGPAGSVLEGSRNVSRWILLIFSFVLSESEDSLSSRLFECKTKCFEDSRKSSGVVRREKGAETLILTQ